MKGCNFVEADLVASLIDTSRERARSAGNFMKRCQAEVLFVNSFRRSTIADVMGEKSSCAAKRIKHNRKKKAKIPKFLKNHFQLKASRKTAKMLKVSEKLPPTVDS